MANDKKAKPHIFLGQTGKPQKYTYAGSGGGGDKVYIPELNRVEQSAKIQSQLKIISDQQTVLKTENKHIELKSGIGIQIAFESFKDVDLKFESLANQTQGIELLNVRENKSQIFANVYVPDGKLEFYSKKLTDYLEYKKNTKGIPLDNQKLIDAIQTLKVATLESLWTDDRELFPSDENEKIWWEVWLPVLDDRNAVIEDFRNLADRSEITVSDSVLEFPERSVLLAQGNINQFSSSSLLLNKVSELRKAKETAEFFDELPINEQAKWTDELLLRVQLSNKNPPYICILDTGANIGHPLISPFIDESDQYSLDPNWSPTDDDGHGTGMVGLSIWGDLTDVLSSSHNYDINHRVESVKLLRHGYDNEGRHHGIMTADGISLPEIENFERTRIFTMAITATDSRDHGRPSAWSSTLDGLTSDYFGSNLNRRLILVSAGNSQNSLTEMKEYPNCNLLQDVHDPGQSWNAVTIGAFTEKTNITEQDCTEYSPLAPYGGISPYSTTSVVWDKQMPIKPEVMFEGGNVGVDKSSTAGIPSLKLLTTHHNIQERHYSTFEATSAATALAGKFAAELYSQYPDIWPETVRGLMVHSAKWTMGMIQQFPKTTTIKEQYKHLVRCVGYGVPNMQNALWSMNNSLSLIIEDELQPYKKDGKDGKKGKTITNEMHLHDIPWPTEILQELGEIQVTMKVTLSYFIEPNPSSRNVSGKYTYPSHQLRFDVKRSLETPKAFQKRISKHAREDGEELTKPPGDTNWLLGDFRNKGSIHKDIWEGSAVELSERGQIIVYPASGWWRSRTRLECWDKKARYCLIVSISVPDVSVDIYTDIINKIETPITIKSKIDTNI